MNPASPRAHRYTYQAHRWTSLLCTLFLLLLCVTGLPLIFSDEIEAWSSDGAPATKPQAGPPTANLDAMVDKARSLHRREVVRFVFVDEEEARVKVVMAPADSPNRRLDHRIEFDAHSGALLANAPPADQLGMTPMRLMLRLHTGLLAGFAGEMLLAGVGLLFVVAIVSGVLLYGPFMKHLPFGTVRSKSRRLKWLDLHNLLGMCVLAWTLCVGVTGVLNELAKPLSAVWRSTQMGALLSAYKGLPMAEHLSPAQAAFETVRAALPDRNVTSILFPSTSFSNPHHYLVWTNGNTPLTRRLFTAALVDARTGQLTAIAQMPLYLRTLQLARPLHFGDYGGPPLKILWALLDLATIAVLVSGLVLWAARRKAVSERAARLEGADTTDLRPS